MFVIQYMIVLRIQKKQACKCNFHCYVEMPIMTSQILKFGFIKPQKSRYLENEIYFLQIKKIIPHQGLLYDKK